MSISKWMDKRAVEHIHNGILSEWVSQVAQSWPTLCDPTDFSLPGSSTHGIFQARILAWVAIPFSRGTSQPRDQTWLCRIVGRRFTVWATREAPMEYYSAIKKNAFESVLMRWMKLEPIIQSEVSQKEKHQYSILTHMEFRKMVTMTLYARQQKRHRCKEQTFGLCGRGRGWDDLGKWHWNMYTIM